MTTTIPEIGKEYDVKLLGDLVVYVPVEETNRPAGEMGNREVSHAPSAGRPNSRPGVLQPTSQRNSARGVPVGPLSPPGRF